MSVCVITDSACSLPRDELERLRICVVPLHVIEDGRPVPDTDDALKELYDRLSEMELLPTTSQPAPAEFADAFSCAVERGDDVLGVFISSKMSATFQSAETGAATLEEAAACIDHIVKVAGIDHVGISQGERLEEWEKCTLLGV